MVRLLESKVTAWVAMVLVVAMVVISVLLHTPWYGLIAEFFLFLGIFSHLSSLYLRRMSATAGRKLETSAMVCMVLGVIGFIVEYFMFQP